MSVLPNAQVYNDFHGLRELKLQSTQQGQQQQALQQVAKQFESIFLHMMLKGMREAGGAFESDLMQSSALNQYEQWYDQQLATSLSEHNSIGIAEMLVQQLSPQAAVTPEASYELPERPPASIPLPSAANDAVKASPEAEQEPEEPIIPVNAPAAVAAETEELDEAFDSFESPADFVRKLYPLAERAAEKLGVDPKVLVAQAALETGWGRYVIQDGEQGTSHNLFNIKAMRDWEGESVRVGTLEYRDGVARREQHAFRRYESFSQSFEDYAQFLQRHQRYANSLTQAGDSRAYVEALQEAGYATDPRYADKIVGILDGELLQVALAENTP